MREMRSYKMCHQHEENSSTPAEQSTSGWEIQIIISIWKSYVQHREIGKRSPRPQSTHSNSVVDCHILFLVGNKDIIFSPEMVM